MRSLAGTEGVALFRDGAPSGSVACTPQAALPRCGRMSPLAARDTAFVSQEGNMELVREAWDAWLRGDVNDLLPIGIPRSSGT